MNAAELLEALCGILNAETEPLHVGYDCFGRLECVDAIRTDDDAFIKARAVAAKALAEQVSA